MAKRGKKEILSVSTRASNTEIDNVLEGVNLYRDAGFFYAYANAKLPKSATDFIVKSLEAEFKRDLAFVNDVFFMLSDRTSVDALIALLKSARDKSDAKRRALLSIAQDILMHLQTP